MRMRISFAARAEIASVGGSSAGLQQLSLAALPAHRFSASATTFYSR